ncbi:hypothetical protein A9Q99_16720 [Gammaproteobacteria bacterium 45_16_T64]|nr:hypothetical protein A9Q99_16720 [Gammaproteobacteria bacterium 45_16_T64]
MKKYFFSLTLFISVVSTTHGSEMVYVPVNPSFGGNPMNGTMLLNNAQAQNTFKDPDAESLDLDSGSGIDDFNDSLQRSLLSRLTSTLSGSIVDDEGNLIPGSLETSDFIVDIVDQGDGTISVTTTDKATGGTTTFIVNSI